MKMRLFALSAGLALLLSACLPDLPDPVGQVEVTVTPGEAAMVSMDWTITGAASFRPEVPVEYEGTCAAGCAQFEETVLMGTWELRITPPEFDPIDGYFGWVATGSTDELTADFISEFTVEQQETHTIEANFRRAHAFEWEYSTTNDPASVTVDVRRTNLSSDFQPGGLVVSCTPAGSTTSLEFVMPSSGSLLIDESSQAIGLEYDGPQDHPLFTANPSCRMVEAWDSDNRPVGHRYVGD